MIKINVLGYGQMGRQIASLLCLIGCEVTVWNRTTLDETIVFKQLKLISKFLNIPTKEQKIRTVISIDDLSKNSLTIETIIEDINIKQKLFQKYKEGEVNGSYYTNTSSYSPAEIGDEVGGLHFFNPISLKLIEYCQPSVVTNNSIDNLLSLLREHQFQVIGVHPNRGYIANSLLFREIANVFAMIEQHKYSVEDIMSIHNAFNRNYNIFDIIDLVGIDTTYIILKNLKSQDNSIYLPYVLEEAVNANILGKKNKTSIRQVF